MNILLVLAFFYWRMPCNALLVSALQPREELSVYIYALRLESPSPGPLPTPLGHHGAPSFPSFPLLWGSFPPARVGHICVSPIPAPLALRLLPPRVHTSLLCFWSVSEIPALQTGSSALSF